MSTQPPTMSEADKQHFRRYFAGLREYNRMEREMKRQEVVDPDRCRMVGDILWLDLRQRGVVMEGDTAKDDEAESRVARAIFAIGSDRRSRKSA